MKYLKYFLMFLPVLCFCSHDQAIDYNKIQGFYEYLVFDHNTGSVVDTLYATARVFQWRGRDTIRFDHNITGHFFGTENKFLGLWSVDEVDNKYIARYYTFYSTDVKAGDNWSLNEELDIGRGTFIEEYSCLSTDTTISVNSDIVFKDIVFIIKRDWVDVGGFWDTTFYGYDKNHRLVYLNQMLINPRDNYIHNKSNYLALNSFIQKEKWSSSDSSKWVDRNSIESKRLFYNNSDYLKDIPPPPPPPEEL